MRCLTKLISHLLDKGFELQRWLKEPDRKINADFIVLLALICRLPDWISALLLDRVYIRLSEFPAKAAKEPASPQPTTEAEEIPLF